MECLDSNGQHYINNCVDGDECYLGTKGDKKCHRLCHPAAPDGGVPDGGVGDGGTTMGDGGVACTCSDVYGLFSSKYNIGLCL